jgi:hypothetical protein
MVFVTDPDNLDRFQVAVDPLGERISVRGLGTVRVDLGTNGDTNGTNIFGDEDANFTASGVAVNDVLAIISSDVADVIGHYTVTGTITATGIALDQTVPDNTVPISYKIAAPASTGQVGETAADGTSLQALYSFLKEEWRNLSSGLGNAEDLIQFTFPLESITREQFEIGGATHEDWDFFDNTTRNLLRTGGWQVLDNTGFILQDYTGVLTLGDLDSDTVVYFQQHTVDEDPTDFVLTGPVNQAINTFNQNVGPDAGTGFVISGSNAVERNDGGNWVTDGYVVGGQVTFRTAEDTENNATFTITQLGDVTDGVLTVATGTQQLTNNAADNTLQAAVNKRAFLKLFARKKARSYVDSDLDAIGVTSLETIVNRFPLTHATDPAIVLDEGQMRGDTTNTAFQVVESHTSGADGTTLTQGDGTFTFTAAAAPTPAFNDGVLRVGDSLNITTDTGNVLGFYEIASIDADDTLTCFEEPLNGAITGASSLSYVTRTGVLISEKSDGQIVDVDSSTGTLTSASSDFDTDGGLGDRAVTAGDMVVITAGPTSSLLGVYKVATTPVSDTVLTLNTTDQNFPAGSEGSYTFTVLDRGMHLQYKSEAVTEVTDLDFNDADPDTIVRNDAGNFANDGYVAGMAITISNANTAANDGTYIVAGVATDTLTLIAEETLTDDQNDTGATINGEVGFIRTISSIEYPFNWRLFANGGDLSEVFQFIQRELRRGRAGTGLSYDIDENGGTSRGDVTDLLMTFASPTGVTLNMFLDDVDATELNNLTQQDLTGDNRNFAFLAGLTIALNANILNDIPANGGTNKIVVYFTDPTGGAGDEFGSNGAIIVQDNTSTDMVAEDQTTSPLQFTFDYDNNAQGGRTPAEDANITIVCIGEGTAQYVQTTGIIQRQNENAFALVSSLERNYSNPA